MGQGCWLNDKTPKVYCHTKEEYIELGFYGGSSLKDPNGLLEGKGKFVRHVKIHTLKDIDEAACTQLILQVV